MTTKTKKQNKAVWISRDKSAASGGDDCCMWEKRPYLNSCGCFLSTQPVNKLVVFEGPQRFFTRITGLRLKPGECKRVRLSVEVVDG